MASDEYTSNFNKTRKTEPEDPDPLKPSGDLKRELEGRRYSGTQFQEIRTDPEAGRFLEGMHSEQVDDETSRVLHISQGENARVEGVPADGVSYTVEVSYSSRKKVARGEAQWSEWDSGTTGSPANELIEGATAIRFVSEDGPTEFFAQKV